MCIYIYIHIYLYICNIYIYIYIYIYYSIILSIYLLLKFTGKHYTVRNLKQQKKLKTVGCITPTMEHYPQIPALICLLTTAMDNT